MNVGCVITMECNQQTKDSLTTHRRELAVSRARTRCVVGIVGVAALLSWVTAVNAQTFSSGSNGSLGAFAPGANTTVALPPDGVLNYTTITIPAGVTVMFTPNAANTPVTMLATGDVSIAGTVNVDGTKGTGGIVSSGFVPGKSGGPGGFAGGAGGMGGVVNTFGSPGLGPGGGVPVTTLPGGPQHAVYGAPGTFVSLLPLFGGSGGAGGQQTNNSGTIVTGEPGAGGGGAIVVASTTMITVTNTGTITARGGDHVSAGLLSSSLFGGVGSGGVIRLVAPQITNQGTLAAAGGRILAQNFEVGGTGRIRAEAFVFGPFAATSPAASLVNQTGPVTSASTPALVNLPTLTFTSVGGVAPPTSPTGSFTTADVALPPATTNPVSVTLTATNTPAPTTYTIKVLPRFASPVSQTVNSGGSFAISTATANVTFPNGVISGLQAFAGFTLTASLTPIIDGEPADQVLLAAGYGEPSTLTLVTKSGKEVPVSQLSQEDQLKVVMAFEAMRNETR